MEEGQRSEVSEVSEVSQANELPRAVFRSSPEDFVVEEIPAYTASGKGEHLFITVRKTRLKRWTGT